MTIKQPKPATISQPYSIPGTPVGPSPWSFGECTTQVSTSCLLKMFQTNGVVPRSRATPGVKISNRMCLSLLNSMEAPPLPPGSPCHVFNCTSELPFTESPEYLKFFCENFRLTQMSSIHAVYSMTITARSDILSSNRPLSSNSHV